MPTDAPGSPALPTSFSTLGPAIAAWTRAHADDLSAESIARINELNSRSEVAHLEVDAIAPMEFADLEIEDVEFLEIVRDWARNHNFANRVARDPVIRMEFVWYAIAAICLILLILSRGFDLF